MPAAGGAALEVDLGDLAGRDGDVLRLRDVAGGGGLERVIARGHGRHDVDAIGAGIDRGAALDPAYLGVGDGGPCVLVRYHAYGLIEWMCREAGSEKVLFGADYPWFDPFVGIGCVVYAHLEEHDMRNILYNNARRLIDEQLEQLLGRTLHPKPRGPKRGTKYQKRRKT